MNRINIIAFAVVICSLWLGACKSRTSETEASSTQTQTAHAESESHIVSLSQAQIDAVGIETGRIEQKNISSSVKVNGTLEVPAQNKALVSALAGGTLRSIHVHPGSAVRKGQVIATILNTELSGIQQQLISVNASLKLAMLERARQKELVAGNAAPLKNLQRAEAELSSLRAQQAALQRQLSTLGISPSSVSTGNISSVLRVTAPISGTISDIHAQIGSKVDAATPVAQIVNNSQLHLDLFVYEKDLPRIRIGQIIHFTLTNNPGKEYDARIYSVGTAFVNETKTVPVHAEVEGNKTGLIEGMNVTAIISIGSKTSAAVPTEAIVSAGGKDYVFVRTDKPAPAHDHAGDHAGEGHPHEERMLQFERIEVARGSSDLGYSEIVPVAALPENAQIVVKGAFFLMASLTNTGEHEH